MHALEQAVLSSLGCAQGKSMCLLRACSLARGGSEALDHGLGAPRARIEFDELGTWKRPREVQQRVVGDDGAAGHARDDQAGAGQGSQGRSQHPLLVLGRHHVTPSVRRLRTWLRASAVLSPRFAMHVWSSWLWQSRDRRSGTSGRRERRGSDGRESDTRHSLAATTRSLVSLTRLMPKQSLADSRRWRRPAEAVWR